jgi:hypothetical protein
MEFFACLIGGAVLIACGVGLLWVHPPNWQSDGELLELPQKSIARWSRFQRVLRLVNNVLLILIGGSIMASAFVPHGRVWIVLWMANLLLLLLCILFAIIDAFSTLAGYRRALPEAARRSLGGERESLS